MIDVATIEHREGVDWFLSPRPFRFHRHRWQTRAWDGFERVERCRCGAFGDGRGHWVFLHPDKPRTTWRPWGGSN